MIGGDLYHPAVGAAMTAAADLLRMDVIYLGVVSGDEFSFERVVGELPGVKDGATASRVELGVISHVCVPISDGDGREVMRLGGLDRGSVTVSDETIRVLGALAAVIEAHVVAADGDIVVRRTAAGWQVGADSESDLTNAMALADLLAGDFGTTGRPRRADGEITREEQLEIAVEQLEHALTARVVIEQAIGVLSERQHVAPRMAFERLRKAARSRGRKVHELARMIVASATDPAVPLPPELAGRSAPAPAPSPGPR